MGSEMCIRDRRLEVPNASLELRKHFQVRGGVLTRAGRGTGAAGHLGGHLHGLGVVVDAHVDVHAHLELEVLEAARELGLVDACGSDR